MDAAILLVGDELLTGHTRDANGQYLAARLTAMGHRVAAIRVAPDDDAAIARDVHALLDLAPLLIVTGGLGPTHDDRTTVAVAKAFGLSTIVEEAAFASLMRRYEARFKTGVPPHVLEAGRKMVTVPKGATPVPNPKGAALGFAIHRPPGAVVILPGVPIEMQAMFEEEVAGKIVPVLVPQHVEEVFLRLPEAEFSAGLARLARDNPTVSIGSYPKYGNPEVTIRLRGPREAVQHVRSSIEAAYKEHVVIRPTGQESG